MTRSESLEKAVLAAVKRNPQGRDAWRIWSIVHYWNMYAVSASLQRLRRRGLIKYDRKGGWAPI